MRNRNVHIQFWLNRKEAEALDKKVKRSSLSREAYLRHLVSGNEPREAPPADYYGMMREIYAIGKNLNQIAQKAHVLNVMDAQRYDAEVRKLEAAIKTITEAVVLPAPMEETRGTPRSQLRGEKERPRSGEPFAACGESDKRSAV